MSKYIKKENTFVLPNENKSGSAPAFDEREYNLEDLTCHNCKCREKCEYVDDPYNTDGDCLAMK